MKMGQKKHPQSFLKTFHPHYVWGKTARQEILPPSSFNTALFNWPELKKRYVIPLKHLLRMYLKYLL